MIRMRSVLAAVSPASLMIPIALALLLGWQSIGGLTSELDQAHMCAIDWQQAIEALEGGAREYQGRCVGLSIGEVGDIPQDFYDQVDLAWQDYANAAERLLEDPWGHAAGHMGGMALLFLALFMGALITGSPLGSAITAWGLSNGWTRPFWARSSLALASLVVVVAYVIAMAAAMLDISIGLRAADVSASIPLPNGAAFAPLAGLLFYSVVGVLAGLITGRGEIGGMTAVLFAIADFVASARFNQFPAFPSTWHQALLGQDVESMSMPVAAVVASIAAVALAAGAYWFMTRRRDVPDR